MSNPAAKMSAAAPTAPREIADSPSAEPGLHFREINERVRSLVDKTIFFVGGVEKSGTSWLQRLLDLHPEVVCAGEAHFLESLFPALKKALEDHNRYMLDRNENPFLHEVRKTHPVFDYSDLRYVVASAIMTLLLKASRGKPARAVGERTTKNVHDFGMLADWFPGAKCIHIVRDPRDSGISHWFYVRRRVPPEARDQMVPKAAFVRQHVEYWKEIVSRGVRFGQRYPDRYLELRYEDLVEETVPVLTRVFRFLGVDDSPEVVEGCAREASFKKLSGGRGRGEENPDSFFRKGVVGDWKNHLDGETNDYVIARAGPTMKHFGYL